MTCWTFASEVQSHSFSSSFLAFISKSVRESLDHGIALGQPRNTQTAA